MNKYIDLAKKLKRMAEQGIGGEKYNAQKQLDRIMRQHDIIPEMLEEQEVTWVKFIVPVADRNLFFQIVVLVVGKDAQMQRRQNTKTSYALKCTKLQETEIRARYHFFRKAYKDQLEIFFLAFIQKNELYADNDEFDTSTLTKDQLGKIKRALVVSDSLEKSVFYPVISGTTSTTGQ